MFGQHYVEGNVSVEEKCPVPVSPITCILCSYARPQKLAYFKCRLRSLQIRP